MEKDFAQVSKEVHEYVMRTFRPEDEQLLEIRQRAEKEGLRAIHVGEMDGLHLEVIARAMGAKKIVEIGTLAGYSGVRLARALPPGGTLYTFELSEKNAKVAEQSFRLAGLLDKTKIIVGPALDNLDTIKGEGPFDLIFIDADKVSYPAYFKWAANNLRLGGAILGDNTFANGDVGKEASETSDAAFVAGIQAFNKLAVTDPRFLSTILPTGEGLTMSVKIA